jgi:hypothetical protein
MDLGENDLRARGTDVDADGGQRDIVLQPQRIVFERAVIGVEIVVVIVIGIVRVHMRDVPAVEMIGQRVFGFLFSSSAIRFLSRCAAPV